MRVDTAHRALFTGSMLMLGVMGAWGIVYENASMLFAVGFGMCCNIGVLLGAMLSVLVDIRDTGKGK